MRIQKIKVDGEKFSRKTYDGDFDDFILDNIITSDIEEYAERNLNMIEEGECDCKFDPADVEDDVLIAEFEERGFVVLRCDSIIDKQRAEEIKDKFLCA